MPSLEDIPPCRYTANLAAFLTYQEYKVVGPQSLAELRASHACIACGEPYDVWPGNLVRTIHTSASVPTFEATPNRRA